MMKELYTSETTLSEKILGFNPPFKTSLRRSFDIQPPSPRKQEKKSLIAYFKDGPAY